MKDNNRNNDDAQKEKKIADLAKYLEENSLTIDEYLSEEEWSKFLENSGPAGEGAIPDETYGPVYNATLRKSKIKRSIYTGAKLAAVLIICVSAWFLLNVNSYFSRSPAVLQTAFTHKNITEGTEKITLPDGSGILLHPGSEISYRAGFNKERRDLDLTGSAIFDVARNDRSPFTVYCRAIATTAIGTRFQVNGWGEHPYVHLYEGKVIVKGTGDSTVSRYLAPGQAIAYVEKENIFMSMNGPVEPVRGMKAASAGKTKASAPQPAAATPVEVKDETTAGRSYLNFQNKKLSTIFDYLAERYNVEIRYPTDIALSTNMLLSVDAGQPVDKILENICRVNGLKANKLDDRTYLVTK